MQLRVPSLSLDGQRNKQQYYDNIVNNVYNTKDKDRNNYKDRNNFMINSVNSRQ